MAREQFTNLVTVQQDTTFLGSQSIYGLLTVDTVALPVQIGATPLELRSSLFIQADNDNAGTIFIGLDDQITTEHYAMKLSPGQTVEFSLVGDNSPSIHAISDIAGNKISIIEGVD